MSWRDIEADLLAAADPRDGIPVLPSAERSAAVARWIDEHYVPKSDFSLGAGDLLLTLPEDPVARDHARLEVLLSENAEVIASFAKDAEAAVRIVAMMIGMDGVR